MGLTAGRRDGLAEGGAEIPRTTVAAATATTAPHVLDRGSTVAAPSIAWAGDITHLWTEKGRRPPRRRSTGTRRCVIGWRTAQRLTESSARRGTQVGVGRMAMSAMQLVHQTDLGRQNTSAGGQRVLRPDGLAVIRSRKGHGWSNAFVESFLRDVEGRAWRSASPSRALAQNPPSSSTSRSSTTERGRTSRSGSSSSADAGARSAVEASAPRRRAGPRRRNNRGRQRSNLSTRAGSRRRRLRLAGSGLMERGNVPVGGPHLICTRREARGGEGVRQKDRRLAGRSPCRICLGAESERGA